MVRKRSGLVEGREGVGTNLGQVGRKPPEIGRLAASSIEHLVERWHQVKSGQGNLVIFMTYDFGGLCRYQG